jgi:hypothetical protein
MQSLRLIRAAKVGPSSGKNRLKGRRRRRRRGRRTRSEAYQMPDPPLPMVVVRFRTLLKLYGGQRHPKTDSYMSLKRIGALTSWRFL